MVNELDNNIDLNNNLDENGENNTEFSPNLGDFLFEKPEIQYHLSDFDGPFDLLYKLIKDQDINIEDIFISDITSQYVEIVTHQPKDEIDYDYTGEFIALAAELVYLKSIRTLPKDEEVEITPDDPEWEREEFIRKMKEFALLKEKSAKLKEIETLNRFYREPTYSDKDYRVALVNFSLPKLCEAFARIIAISEKRVQEIVPKTVEKDRFSVNDQMINIRASIKTFHEMKMTDLFEKDFDRKDIVTTFLALLELLKYGIVTAVQDEVFGDITIFEVEGADDIYFNVEESDYGKQ